MAASSTSTVDELPPQHQVFIIFRGEDLRRGFVSHLASALAKHNINIYMDSPEDRGQPLEILFDRIRESTIALCIFSSNYTESACCLDELTIINECMERRTLMAIPIFYKLEPSNVRHMTGEFGDAFRNLAISNERKKQWKRAVKSITHLMGITVHESRYVVEGIQQDLGHDLIPSSLVLQSQDFRYFNCWNGYNLTITLFSLTHLPVMRTLP